MKNFIAIIFLVLVIASCKNDKNMDAQVSENDSINNLEMSAEVESAESSEPKTYPAALQNVFAAHGGLDTWKKMNNLCFHIKSGNEEEVHTISLKNRHDKIEHKDWTIGNDNNGIWLLKNKVGYEGKPTFYNNLMFYFYAMPFVLADEGTIYTKLPQTELDGRMYNAYKIGFENGVGVSPKDEYIIYINTESNQTEWLAYTVTYKKTETSSDFHFIKYDKWEEINGLLLPEKITFWNVEDGKPTDERNDIRFTDVTITETILEDSVFAKPAEAKYVTE